MPERIALKAKSYLESRSLQLIDAALMLGSTYLSTLPTSLLPELAISDI